MTISLGAMLEEIEREVETEAQTVDELRSELAGLRLAEQHLGGGS